MRMVFSVLRLLLGGATHARTLVLSGSDRLADLVVEMDRAIRMRDRALCERRDAVPKLDRVVDRVDLRLLVRDLLIDDLLLVLDERAIHLEIGIAQRSVRFPERLDLASYLGTA